MIDIGVNLSNPRFANDIIDTLKRATQAGVKKLVLTGTSIDESRSVLALCENYSELFPEMLYATAGIHPHDASTLHTESICILRELAARPEVVAIGEMGLDFNRNFSTPAEQEKAFEAQLELAIELQLPVFLHERDAADRQLQILKSYRDDLSDAVTHCFTGSKQALFGYLDLNMHIGITGWICDEKRGEELQQLVNNIPLERLMVETDAPYLLPKNMLEPPKGKRNEPSFLPWVIEGIAEFRKESSEQLAVATSANATRFFKLDQKAQ
jgi:TatD DNase family protein